VPSVSRLHIRCDRVIAESSLRVARAELRKVYNSVCRSFAGFGKSDRGGTGPV
jgi:hypothetical protein